MWEVVHPAVLPRQTPKELPDLGCAIRNQQRVLDPRSLYLRHRTHLQPKSLYRNLHVRLTVARSGINLPLHGRSLLAGLLLQGLVLMLSITLLKRRQYRWRSNDVAPMLLSSKDTHSYLTQPAPLTRSTL